MDVTRQMREEWNRRAREDPFFYAGFGRRQQRAEEFLTSAVDTIRTIEGELSRLPPGPPQSRRALEIGCGPGRLMLQLSKNFGEILWFFPTNTSILSIRISCSSIFPTGRSF